MIDFVMIRILAIGLAIFSAAPLRAAEAPIYVILWFDTEDYILPASDDAALRLANWLTQEKIRATFKVVGEKARTLERRGRQDVIAALARHEIGYHSNWHSVPPTPAQYLNELGWDEGVAEFDRRERPGFDDVARIFGQTPSCYGQPGSSWGPQSFGALRRWGVPVYLDGGRHIDLDNRPLYFCGLLTLYKIDIIRTRLGGADDLAQTEERFAAARRRLQAEGGGIISIIYHPCEFVHQEFWDAANFRHGTNPPRADWKLPRQKSPDQTEAAFRNFEEYVRFIQRFPDVRFITARDAAAIWNDRAVDSPWTSNEIRAMAARVGNDISFQQCEGERALAPSEILALLANWLEQRQTQGRSPPSVRAPARTPLGPASAPPRLAEPLTVARHEFLAAASDVAAILRSQDRVPSAVWFGSQSAPPEAFLAAAAKIVVRLIDGEEMPAQVEVAPATLATTRFVADDNPDLWKWVIFPPGFRGPKLMDLAKLQAWTIKPALRERSAPKTPPRG